MKVSNVTTGKPKVGGAIHRAPVGTPLPTSATEALNSAFIEMGYLSEDGLKNSNSPDTDKIKAWGGDTVLVTQNGKDDTFSGTFIEATNAEVLKMVYGDKNVAGSLATGITIKANSDEAESYSYVFDMILRDNTLKRIVLPSAKVSDVGDITYSDDDVVGYETTLNAAPDDAGNTHYEYIVAGKTYNVTYDGNKSDGGTAPVDNTAYTAGASVTVLGNTGNLTKSGSTFAGWATSASATSATYVVGATFEISKNTTLYAVWRKD